MGRAAPAAPPEAPRRPDGARRAVRRAALARSSPAAAATGRRPRRPAARPCPRRWPIPTATGRSSAGPGEPLRDRTELAARGRARTLATLRADHRRPRPRRGVARRARRSSIASAAPFTSTFRPQEALSRAGARRDGAGGERARARRRARDRRPRRQRAGATSSPRRSRVLDGGAVGPDIGRPRLRRACRRRASPTRFFYRPDVDAPRHPGLLAAAQRPFRAPGLAAPWYPALGNHDLLVQGEVPPTAQIDAVATGGRLVTGLDPRDPPCARRSTGASRAAAAVDAICSRAACPGRPQPRRRRPAAPRC